MNRKNCRGGYGPPGVKQHEKDDQKDQSGSAKTDDVRNAGPSSSHRKGLSFKIVNLF